MSESESVSARLVMIETFSSMLLTRDTWTRQDRSGETADVTSVCSHMLLTLDPSSIIHIAHLDSRLDDHK